MKCKILMMIFFFGGISIAQGQQRAMTKKGKASFFSKAPLENIEAHNSNTVAILDVNSHEIAVKMLIKQFNFENSLMQEHFNENYMESDQFPSATFSGKIIEGQEVWFNKDGEYKVQVAGELKIHGVAKQVETTVLPKVRAGIISAETAFKVKTADYDIKIPKLVIKNIAEVIDVNLSFEFDPINS